MKPAAAAALAAAVLLGGCGGGGGAPGPRRTPTPTAAQRTGGDRPAPATPAQLVQALLDRRAAALQDGDAGAYARTATGSQRTADRRDARRARRIGLRDVRLVARDVHIDGRRADVRARLGYGARGVRGTFSVARRLVARRTAAGWRIARIRGGRARLPWEVAAYRRRDERHFVVLVPPGLDVDAAGLPDALATGYRRFGAALPRARLRQRYLVVIAADASAARRLTQDISGVEGLAAVSDTAVREEGPARQVTDVLSQRLLVVWPPFAALPADQRIRVVAHELTHLVLAGATSGRTPSWLIEGIALYVSGDRRDAQASAILRGAAGTQGEAARPALDLRRLSTPNAIAHLDGAEQAGAYAYASAAAFTLADEHGRRALLRLYEAFGDPSLRGKPGPRLVDRALRRTVGEGLTAFERQVRARLG